MTRRTTSYLCAFACIVACAATPASGAHKPEEAVKNLEQQRVWEKAPASGDYAAIATACADYMIEHGRDVYGKVHSPLFMTVLTQVEQSEYYRALELERLESADLVSLAVCMATSHHVAAVDKLSCNQVIQAVRKAADWQLKHPNRRPMGDWLQGPFINGLFAISQMPGNGRYLDAVIKIGERAKWGVITTIHPANDHCTPQTWLDIYQIKKDSRMLAPTRKALDEYIQVAKTLLCLTELGHSCWPDQRFISWPARTVPALPSWSPNARTTLPGRTIGLPSVCTAPRLRGPRLRGQD